MFRTECTTDEGPESSGPFFRAARRLSLSVSRKMAGGQSMYVGDYCIQGAHEHIKTIAKLPP